MMFHLNPNHHCISVCLYNLHVIIDAILILIQCIQIFFGEMFTGNTDDNSFESAQKVTTVFTIAIRK